MAPAAASPSHSALTIPWAASQRSPTTQLRIADGARVVSSLPPFASAALPPGKHDAWCAGLGTTCRSHQSADALTGRGKTLECGHSGAQALAVSPEPKNTVQRNQGLGLCAWVPGLALKGHPGRTAEFLRTLLMAPPVRQSFALAAVSRHTTSSTLRCCNTTRWVPCQRRFKPVFPGFAVV